MALQPFIGPWPLVQFRNLFSTDGMTPLTGDQPVARLLPTHRTTETQNKRTHRHSCLEWDLNPRSQRSRERRQFMQQIARPPWWVNLFSRCYVNQNPYTGNLVGTQGLFFRKGGNSRYIRNFRDVLERTLVQRSLRIRREASLYIYASNVKHFIPYFFHFYMLSNGTSRSAFEAICY
jgi:hypothetical protein